MLIVRMDLGLRNLKVSTFSRYVFGSKQDFSLGEVMAEEEQLELALEEMVRYLVFWRSLGLMVTLVDGCSSKEETVAQNKP